MNKTIVLIPHYNNNKGLKVAIQSIGKNELVDVMIVDDGSQKNTINEHEILKAAKFKGEVLFVYLNQNSGIEIALNTGLKKINDLKKHSYIARLDCDDICAENRFQIQEKFLDHNKNIYLVGSNATAIDTKGNVLFEAKFPRTYKEIQNKMFVNSMHLHPCVMFRIEVLN